MQFQYKAIDREGKSISGILDVASRDEALAQLKQKGLFVESIELSNGEIRKDKPSSIKVIAKKLNQSVTLATSGIKSNELNALVRQIATLITAGLPLMRCLNILKEQQKNGALKTVLTHISEDVKAGSSFSEAVGKFPRIFNNLFTSMVRAGEVGGVLGLILSRLAEFSEKSQAFRSRVKGALVYPLVVVVMAVIVMIVLIVVVVPKFKDIFADLGTHLPLPTVILLNISSLLFHYGWVVVVVLMALFWSYRAAMRVESLRYMRDRLLLRVPLFGVLLQKIVVVRFTRTLGTLVGSGVPILQALDIVRDTMDNLVYRETIRNLQSRIREGESIAKPLAESGVFPAIMTNMIDVGEETGKLEEMLLRTSDVYEMEVDTTVTGLTKIIEPLMIVVMALLVGYIVISMFLPLVSMMNTLSN